MIGNTTTINNISFNDWSLMLDATGGGRIGVGLGRVVQGLDDVAQCIQIILTTPKGSDPLRPTFGADLWEFVDMPINLARPAIVREATEAITLWEPRAEVVKVSTQTAPDEDTQRGARLNVSVVWRLKLTNRRATAGDTQTTTVLVTA